MAELFDPLSPAVQVGCLTEAEFHLIRKVAGLTVAETWREFPMLRPHLGWLARWLRENHYTGESSTFLFSYDLLKSFESILGPINPLGLSRREQPRRSLRQHKGKWEYREGDSSPELYGGACFELPRRVYRPTSGKDQLEELRDHYGLFGEEFGLGETLRRLQAGFDLEVQLGLSVYDLACEVAG